MKFSVITAIILTALIARGQEPPPPTAWEGDPLDVLEAPATNGFTDIPAAGGEVPPPPEIMDAPTGGTLTEAPLETPMQNPMIETQPSTPLEETAQAPTAEPTPETTPKKVYKRYRGYRSNISGSEVDIGQETYFHNIYKSFNQQPTDSQMWEQVVGNRRSETYAVQSGDTLWDISHTLFGDANYWPKIWSLNNESIQNPHKIDPSMAVRFYPGTSEDAPTLSLAANSAAGSEATMDSVEAEGTPQPARPAISDASLIPPAKKSNPVLKSLPPSLPTYSMGGLAMEKVEVRVQIPRSRFAEPTSFIEYFLEEKSVEGSGKILSSESGASTVGDQQLVYVEIEGTPDSHYIIQKNHSKIKSDKFFGGSAQMIQVMGEIEIKEKVNDSKNIYRALVTHSLNPIEVGSEIVAGAMPMMELTKTTVERGVGGVIIGAQNDNDRKVIGPLSFVFIDNGSEQGLLEGYTLPIYGNARIRNKKSKANINDLIIGYVKIVRTSKNFATGYVLSASTEIQYGDYVGTLNQLQAKNQPVNTEAVSDEGEFSEFEDEVSDEGLSGEETDGGDEEFEL